MTDYLYNDIFEKNKNFASFFMLGKKMDSLF
jgi:hypothetical protein